jgi:hypothetical protein
MLSAAELGCAPCDAGTPLAAPTAGMAELLRRVAERRRVEDSEGDSDSEW